ncbi:MAG: PepSY-associated TM helix domain-containing protein [Comamonas sp.]
MQKHVKQFGAGQGGFRQAQAWLHTWCGLWFSWLLFAVFLTGTLAVFEEPITHWMTPEHHHEEAAAAQAHGSAQTEPTGSMHQRLAWSIAYMKKQHPGAGMWELWPADAKGAGELRVYWFDAQGQYAAAELDPRTGEPLPESPHPPLRQTMGGHHFVNFHYELHAGQIGLWIVGGAAFAMLVALVSGVITHRRIFKDFFTFRSHKGQRSWLDAHNAVAVLTLPFQLMIAYTGIAISGLTFMPAGIAAYFGAGQEGTRAFLAALNEPDKPPRAGQAMDVPDLGPFVLRGQALIGQPVRAVVIDSPGDAAARIGVYGWNDADSVRQRLSATSGMAMFSAASGDLLQVRQPGEVDGGTPSLVQSVLGGLHMVTFGGLALKWVYFICGLAGSAMMATGAILFAVKRRAKHLGEFGSATAAVYRLIEGLNVAAIVGLAVACAGYLWANRLVPLGLAHRDDWELGVFFGLWLLALLHAWMRPPAVAWREQLGVLVLMCLLLPVLNFLTTGDHLLAHIGDADWESAAVELFVLAIGIAAGCVLYRLLRAPRTKSRRPSMAIRTGMSEEIQSPMGKQEAGT